MEKTTQTKKFDFTRRNPRTKAVENAGRMEIRNTANAAELYIYGDIVSTEWDAWSAEDTFPQGIADFLSQIDDAAPLTVYINSGGGDVFAGIAIHSILRRHSGPKKGVVDALAASIASVILMACDEIVVNSGAQIMIHKPSTIGWGNADDFQKLIGELDKCQQSITEIYMSRVKDQGIMAIGELFGYDLASIKVIRPIREGPLKNGGGVRKEAVHLPGELLTLIVGYSRPILIVQKSPGVYHGRDPLFYLRPCQLDLGIGSCDVAVAERKTLGSPGGVVNAVIRTTVLAVDAFQILATFIMVCVGQEKGIDAETVICAASKLFIYFIAGYEKPPLGIKTLGGGEDDRLPLQIGELLQQFIRFEMMEPQYIRVLAIGVRKNAHLIHKDLQSLRLFQQGLDSSSFFRESQVSVIDAHGDRE